ncbi:hypothetical protein [Streptosporangium sp. NPDC006930]
MRVLKRESRTFSAEGSPGTVMRDAAWETRPVREASGPFQDGWA